MEWIKPHQVKRFFESKIEPNSELILKYLNLDCFICIKSIFLKINESENWLNIVDKPKMTEDTSNFRKIGEFANESQFKSAGSKR